mmetsp:Transcript_12725/g.29438  ORF Transcript_12725/g.29438 Transcript_12725/m.29438 type:complete len:287 (-) Transcript_12725:383-1243(-)
MAYFSLMTELEALEQAAAARAPRYMQKFGASDEVFYAKMRLALQSIKPASDCTEGEPTSDLHDRITHLPFAEAPQQPLSQRSSISAPSAPEGKQGESTQDREKRLSAADDSLFAYLRHALETANEPHDHAALPPPYRVTRQSRQSPFSSPRTASAESTTAPHASAEANKLRRFDGSPGGKAHPFRQGMLNRWICALDDAAGPPLPVRGSFGPSTTAQRSASDRRNSVSGTETPPIAVAPGNLRPALRVVPEHFLRFLDRLRHALPAHDFGHGVLIRWSLRFIELPA